MALTPEARVRAAELVVEARRSDHLLGRLPSDVEPTDEADGYLVQTAAHSLLSRAGHGEVVGHKIGCTTEVMQTFLGIPNPCAGGVFDSTVREVSASLRLPRNGRLGVECEIAVVIGSYLPPRRSGYTPRAVAESVGACLCAIEIVEDRYVDYASLKAPTLIADDFFGAGAVLGSRVDFSPDALADVTARMIINGVEVGTGIGRDIMDEPLDALAWLATSRSSRGLGLSAGEFVLLGSLVQTAWIVAGDKVLIENEPLGSAQAFVRRC